MRRIQAITTELGVPNRFGFGAAFVVALNHEDELRQTTAELAEV